MKTFFLLVALLLAPASLAHGQDEESSLNNYQYSLTPFAAKTMLGVIDDHDIYERYNVNITAECRRETLTQLHRTLLNEYLQNSFKEQDGKFYRLYAYRVTAEIVKGFTLSRTCLKTLAATAYLYEMEHYAVERDHVMNLLGLYEAMVSLTDDYEVERTYFSETAGLLGRSRKVLLPEYRDHLLFYVDHLIKRRIIDPKIFFAIMEKK